MLFSMIVAAFVAAYYLIHGVRGAIMRTATPPEFLTDICVGLAIALAWFFGMEGNHRVAATYISIGLAIAPFLLFRRRTSRVRSQMH